MNKDLTKEARLGHSDFNRK